MSSGTDSTSACTSTAAHLPMAGTAPRVRRWFLIEDAGPWSNRAVDDHRAPHVLALREELLPDDRILLVRRRGQRSVSAADASVWQFSPDDPFVLVTSAHSLALNSSTDAVHWSSTDEHPRVLVCTNGKRDTCCAVHGGALIRESGGVSDVWESSHIGGHRFAPTVLHVPTGYVAGRVTRPILETLCRGDSPRIDPDKLRGRSDFSAPEQAADIAVRAFAGWANPFMRTSVVSECVGGDSTNKTFIIRNDDLVSYRVTMVLRSTPQFRESCGADALTSHYWATADTPMAVH